MKSAVPITDPNAAIVKLRWKILLPILLFAIAGSLLWLQRRDVLPDPDAAASPSATRPAYLGKLKFLALGDSYTIGESVSPADRWPVQLAARLREKGIDVSDPVIIARTGWTTADLLAALDSAKLHETFDLVTLQIGVNNQYQGRNADEYETELKQLLRRATALAGEDARHVVVLSIPDWGATPFAAGGDRQSIAAQIDTFNAINRQASIAAGAAFIDITPISREVPKDPSLIASDELHPSAKQYARWTTASLQAGVDAASAMRSDKASETNPNKNQ
jgi:lysophospholipase L1-like esterase